MIERGNKGLKLRLLPALGLAALVFIGLGLYADLDGVIGAFGRFRWGYLPPVLALSSGNYLIRFVRWEHYLGRLRIEIGRRDSLTVFLGGLVMSVTPGKFGEVLKSYLLKPLTGAPISRTAPIVVAERLTDFMGLMILAATGTMSFAYGPQVMGLGLALVAGFLIVAGSDRLSFRAIQALGRLRGMKGLARRLTSAYSSLGTMVGLRSLLPATLIGTAAWACEGVGFYLVLQGFDVPVPLLEAIPIYAFTTLIGAISMLPGGIGPMEGSMAGLLAASGVPGPSAVAATFVIRACTLWFAVAVGAGAMVSYRGAVVSRQEDER